VCAREPVSTFGARALGGRPTDAQVSLTVDEAQAVVAELLGGAAADA
jgi:hypothetical protein